jgi:hypothetical protein
VAGDEDAAEALAVDVQELAGPLPLVANDVPARERLPKPRAAVSAQHRVHRGVCDPERPADHVRASAQLAARLEDCLLQALWRPFG